MNVALLLFAAFEAPAAEPRRVLVLHAFGHAYSPWSDMAASFRAELIKSSPEPIDLYEVSLDTARAQVDLSAAHLGFRTVLNKPLAASP